MTKIYERNTVLDNIYIDIDQGAFLSLLGPSGCGKTTTLRLIAGFENPDGGIIEVDGKTINNIPVFKRMCSNCTMGKSYGLKTKRI
ncbi:MAG: ATP-binding cassette domain-containing protein [Tepidanaerobacteraceae bacterium]|nr:ATP-binding cassette domain-containing protein [Tepidanaerobacteraceae bacterium]